MNKIYGKQIELSIEMKDKWLKSILKKSRKLSSLDKFWNLVIEELGFLYFSDLKHLNIFISEYFLLKLKECDADFKSPDNYLKYSPRTYSEINSEDFTIYITKKA